MTATTQEFNKALVMQAHAARNTHDADAVAQYFAEDVINHDAPPDSPSGREGVKLAAQAGFDAFPDLHVEPHHLLADGDMVAYLTRWSGTHTGPVGHIPASGKRVTMESASIVRIEDGKIAEFWYKNDNLAVMHQIGAIPGPTD